MNNPLIVKNWHEYLEVLWNEALIAILSENENKIGKGIIDEQIIKTNSSIKLILASRKWGNLWYNTTELVSKYQELNKEWERFDSTWRKDEQETISNEMGKISRALFEMWLDTNWEKLKTPKKVEEIKNNFIQLWLDF